MFTRATRFPRASSVPSAAWALTKFKEMSGEMTLAAEHEYGVYGSTVANNAAISDEDKAYILEQLKGQLQRRML